MEGFPQQRRAEDADDAQVEKEADDQHADGPQEGGRRSVGQESRPPWHHVGYHALHLEVGPQDGADVEQLVAVACVTRVKSDPSRCFLMKLNMSKSNSYRHFTY